MNATAILIIIMMMMTIIFRIGNTVAANTVITAANASSLSYAPT